MSKIWSILCFALAVAFVGSSFADGAAAVLIVSVVVAITIILIKNNTADSEFLIDLFLLGLFIRLVFGLFLYNFDLQSFFGNDATLYSLLGRQIIDVWNGVADPNDELSIRAMSTRNPGWGMNYLTAIIFYVFGSNVLAVQSLCGVIGAATAPMVYVCSFKIFQNRRVGKVAALMVAVFPAFVIWSGQMLKDGLIIFLLVLAMTMVISLQEKFNYLAVATLILSLFGILSLRFYIFYMVAIAVAGSFVIGQSGSAKSVVRGLVLMIIVGLSLTYLGVTRTASDNFDRYISLEKVQTSRQYLAKSAESGFGEDVDVSTPDGAISAIPVGITYLMLAPFPWQMGSFRQAITLPEVLVWWALIPLIFTGLWYTIRNRLRPAIPVLIFTLMLTIAYSIFQGNVGTAYRQRTQIQVFLFIFIAVGWTLIQERTEWRLIARQERERRLEKKIKEGRSRDLE